MQNQQTGLTFEVSLLPVFNTHNMKHILTILVVGACFNLRTIYAQPASYFTASDEGWTAYCECGVHPTASWTSTAGSPGGAFRGTDNANGVWYYNSPAAFNIDLTSYYGGTLTFDQKQNTTLNQTSEPDVMLVKGDGTKIVYSTPSNPATSWTHYSVPLSEGGWRYETLLGAAVSYVDFMDFISTFAVIKIRGDYSSNNTESIWMDNVVITGPIILPIELGDFNATPLELTQVSLDWTTLTEIDVNHFEIEKKTSYDTEFSVIGTAGSAGNSTEEIHYNFVDPQFNALSYYRLAIVGIDGNRTYSPVVSAEPLTDVHPEIQVYPNPAVNSISVTSSIFNSTFDNIQILNITGAVLWSTNANSNTTELDITDLPSGVYFLQVYQGNTQSVVKFSVVK